MNKDSYAYIATHEHTMSTLTKCKDELLVFSIH